VIEAGLSGDAEVSWEELGRQVGVATTTVAREVSPNLGRLKYSADAVPVRAGRCQRGPKAAKLVEAGPMRDRVDPELT